MTSPTDQVGVAEMKNFHATAIVLGDRGVLIMGPSGGGKTSLALALVERASHRGEFARLVADDQVLVAEHGGRLVGRVPPTIAGLVELRGIGPRRAPYLSEIVIDLLILLVPEADAPRVAGGDQVRILDVRLPQLELPQHRADVAARAVEACLDAVGFR